MLYVGIDLHRKSSQLTVMGPDGEVVRRQKIKSTPAEFKQVFAELGPEPVEAAFEATFGWGWLSDLLADGGIPAHLAHPLQTKAIASARVKNDSVDATTLAHLLRGNLLPESWIAPPEAREIRRLIRLRATLVRSRTRLKNQIHAVLAEHGITFTCSDTFGRRGRAAIAEASLGERSRNRVDACLRLIDDITREVIIAESELHQLFDHDERVSRLVVIPGIGFLTAVTVIAEIWDIKRFPTPNHLCSWAGLTPREYSSADHIRRGHISKQGSRWVRWALIEAASTPHTHRDPKLRFFYERIAKKKGSQIAHVALARRLLELCFYALSRPDGLRDYTHVPNRTFRRRGQGCTRSAD